MSAEVIGEDGFTDQQREGARPAAAGWRGIDISEHLDVAPETVSRWRKKPEYIAAIESILERGAVRGSEPYGRADGQALDVIEQTLEHRYDSALKLRAAVALLQISGIGRVMSARTAGSANEQTAKGGE
jgi:hypothetical protein